MHLGGVWESIMADFRHTLTGVETKTWLIYVRLQSVLYSRVSLNIIREVCYYIPSFDLLPVLHSNTLRLQNLETGSSATYALQHSFSHGTTICLYRAQEMLLVGNHSPSKEVWSFALDAGALVPLQEMEFARAWSGVVIAQGAVHVFGGNTGPSLRSCEAMNKYTKKWERLPDMLSPKVAFTPTVYKQEIYLGCLMPTECPFEVFNPTNKVFRVLPISLISTFYGCVSFFVGNTMKIITYDQKRVSFHVDSSEQVVESISLKNQNFAISNTPVVIHKEQVWWVNYINGEVVCYDIVTGSFK